MDEILNVILKDTYTLPQLKHRLRILKSYVEQSLFARTTAQPLDQPDLDWLKSLPADFYQKFTEESAMGIFAKIEQDLAKLTILTLHLPFEASETVYSQIGIFSRKAFGQRNLILDIKYDPSLIAGCALSWKGIYKDYSLKARITEKKPDILQSISKYLK